MQNFSKYGINYNPETDYDIRINDLIAIGNIDRNIVETKVLEDNNTSIKVTGEYDISNAYVVVGGEIIKVISSIINATDKTTTVTVTRGLKGTLQENWVGYNFRTVVLVDEFNTEIDLVDWTFEDSIGGVTNNLFPVELTGGSVTLKSDLSLWSPNSLSRKYRVRPKKGIVYIFRGIDEKRFLKHTTVISKVGFNTRSKNDPNRIRLDIKTKLAKWYDKDLSINKQLKGTTPKELFKLLFGLNDDEVYYAEGVSEDSFLKINNLHTKEYKTMSELLKGYCSNGVRFCFDAFERVKIFSDFKVDTINSQKTIYYDLTESTLTEEESMVYNTININSVQRQTLFNFEDLGNKYVSFAKKLASIVSSDKFIKIEENGDYNFNSIQITNESLSNSSQIGDFVCFKRTVAPYYEYNARVIDIGKNNVVTIVPILYDKDFKTLYYGKYAYLYNILNNQICQMDLYYVRQELPMIFKYTRNKGGEERDASLMYPILPKVNGEVLYPQETNITFGCASNLKVGEYTGIVEEVGGVYGTWDNSKLLYNSEIDQFGNTVYPPIFLLTNKINERVTAEGTPLLNYTHFDNSDFLLEVKQPQDTQNDATLIMYNTQTVNKDIDLFVDEEVSRPSNLILEVASLAPYKIGDVLICNKPDDLNAQEETEYDEVLSTIRWTIIGKETQVNKETLAEKHYIYLDSKFAKRQIQGKKYKFTRFPNWSVVFLQELYFRGNPVIQFSQEVVGISKGVNYDGDRSTDIYGEKKYEFDSKQIGKEDMKMMMGYILDNFQATDLNSTKFNAPISTFNGIEIELLDVITVIDPTYNKITDKSKWLVVSATNKSRTNTVQLKLINVNATNTKPFKIDVKDVLEYKPVEIPNYDHNGNEGNGGGDNDGSGGDGVDKSIGVFNMAEVDPKKFRAKVERAEGNYIYFTDLAGEEWETYSKKLFPNSEFGIVIDGESMLVRSDMNFRAFIKKRDIYNTGEKILISAGADVKFLVMSSFTDIDGTFYSRKCMIGDGDTYFAFDTITGAKFVGDFVVGENNQNIDNDLWVSLQNNRTFRQNAPPVTTTDYKLKEGDIWYDLDDENHMYRYNGDVWVSCRDGSIVSTRSSTFVQPTEPTPTTGRPINDGDTWYNTSKGNTPSVYKNGVWVQVTDMTLDEAIKASQVQIDGTMKELEDIASDSKLTPSEKQSTKKDWDIIASEYPKILDEANKFGVDKSFYTTNYNSLNAYITPLLSNLNTTSDINGNEFRIKFKDYYDSRQVVLNSISSKIPEINSMQNGKMLYLDPTFKDGLNDIKVYNNSGNGLVTLVRMTGESFGAKPTNDSNMVLAIKKAVGSVTPSSGGFSFQTQTRSGLKLLSKIVAYIPKGYKIMWASNTTGDGTKNYWVTSQEGIGEFIEYTHVLECGTTGTFSSTSFFYIKANDNDDSKAVTWGLSYATVFDAGANQNDYVTQALGNAKIFYSSTAPISGMKTNDLWYDTDDGNHPYVYNGTIWVSARDQIFLTEGGNKVYFQNAEPPKTGEGTKDGDMWFKTNENNKMFILLNRVWTLADDSLDKINTGRIILNGNTTVNGDFKVKDGNVELGGNTKVYGTLEVFGGANGIMSYNGTSEASSTKRIIIRGGEIVFQEKI